MNPIIVAVDFSNTSITAIEYAIALANKLKSPIQMIWVDKISPQESLYPDTSNQNRNEAKKRFEELISTYSKKLVKGITLEYKLKKGKIYHEVDNLARLTNAELIVTGAHGISGYEEFWVGSNAFKIVTYASFPVSTVRHDLVVRKNIDKILVPIDGSAETVQKLPFVVKLAKLFKSEIHLVTTHNSHLKSIQRIAEKYAQSATSYLKQHSVEFITDTIVANDLTKAVLSYAMNVQVDLIAIMTEQETPVNILLGPQAQQMINQSPVPVLSIHPREHFCL
ncbi:MAG: universal stress protein [Bacteroidota bacterium]